MSAKNIAGRVKAISKEKTAPEDRKDGDVAAGKKTIFEFRCVYNLVKIPRLPATLLWLFPQLAKKFAQRKTSLISSEWSPESKQTHACGCHVENPLPPGADLIPARVKRWCLRDYHLIARKIQALGATKESSRKYNITVLQEEDSTAQSENSQEELWEEMIRVKEERQFQLGRITKYFS